MPSDSQPGGVSKRRIGRRNQLPKATKATIVGCLAAGMTIKEAAAFGEVSPQTVTQLMEDQEFHDMLILAEDVAVNTILQEVAVTVRRGVKELGPRALEVLSDSLANEDARLRLQAAGMVLRGGGLMDGGKDLNIRVGLEGLVGGDSPAAGD